MNAATVVLVHGAWHDAWCWEKVEPLLDRRGIPSAAVSLPLTSFEADVAAVRTVLDEIDGPIVLCAHSYGGAVSTEAGVHERVEHLVYLCAVAPDAREGAMPGADPNDTANDAVDPLVFLADGSAAFDPLLAPAMFYGDCTPSDVSAAVDRLRPIRLECFAGTVTSPAWRRRPSTYVITSEDRALPVPAQLVFAGRCTESIRWDTSHSPFLSHPAWVADLLAGIAAR